MSTDAKVKVIIDDSGDVVIEQDNPDGKENLEATQFVKAISEGGKVKVRVTKPSERHNVTRVQRVGT